jgi:hypothetical protein
MGLAALLSLPALALLLLAAHLVHAGLMPLAVILGSVTLVTVLAALAFQHPVLRAYFRLPAKPAAGPAAR